VMQLLPTAVLAVLCAALGLAWVVEPSIAPDGWTGRLAVLIGGLLVGLLAIRIVTVQVSKQAQSARRYIDSLCELEPHALHDDESTSAIPLRKEDHVWRAVCHRVLATL